MKKRIKHGIICVGVLAVLTLGVSYLPQNDPSTKLLQSKEEIALVLRLQGYRDIVFGPEIQKIGSTYGPCVSLTATYDGANLAGVYCTSKFEDWGLEVTSRKVENIQEVINGSYK